MPLSKHCKQSTP